MEPNAGYHCWLVDQTQVLVGSELLETFDSWAAVEHWWHNPRRERSEYLIGYIGYEQAVLWQNPPRGSAVVQKRRQNLALPAVWFGRFKGLQRLSHSAVVQLPKRTALTNLALQQHMTPARYQTMIKRAKRRLAVGDIYQVNLAQQFRFATTAEPDQLFWELYKKQPVPYAALLQTPDWSVLSHSPELAVRVTANGVVETRPMKGTRPRGRSRATDAAIARELRSNPKEQAELDMIIDIHRNDLQRLCQTGSVRVMRRREAVALKTVWQMQSRIRGQLKRGVSPLAIAQTILPAGSVTGAPKLSATEIIRQLEPTARQVYCGAIGYISGRGTMEFNVAIRTSVLQKKKLYYHSGSGITFQSTAAAEWQETLAKAKIMYS